MGKTQLEESIGQVLLRHPGIRLALLSGSLSRIAARGDSDLDLAVGTGFQRNPAVHGYEAVNRQMVHSMGAWATSKLSPSQSSRH